MEMRVDIVSETTGRVVLSSLFDTPPDGLTRADTVKALQVLIKTKRDLEAVFGEGLVRLSVADYASSVFWYLVLFRAVTFSDENPFFAGRPWSVYEIIQDPKRCRQLKKLNLGLVYDPLRNWLVLVWPEALERGILSNLDSPTWKKVLEDNNAATTDWWKLCAEAHSFVVPRWRLTRIGYIRNMLWFHQGIDYKNITAFDLAGIDLPRVDQQGHATLPTAIRANYAHYYTEDPREFTELRKREEKKLAGKLAAAPRRVGRRKAKREEDAHAKRHWARATRLVCKLPTLLGSPVLVEGRYPKYLSGARSDALYLGSVNARINNQLRRLDRIKWDKVEDHLDELEGLLPDNWVPDEFEKWLNWRDGGRVITREVSE
jgi:hypothetical protein